VTSFTLGFRLFFNLLQIKNTYLDIIGALKTVTRAKIRHYRQLYINRPEPIAFMPVVVDTAGRIYEDFSRLLFLYAHREGRNVLFSGSGGGVLGLEGTGGVAGLDRPCRAFASRLCTAISWFGMSFFAFSSCA
jgi:hypothetical protein